MLLFEVAHASCGEHRPACAHAGQAWAAAPRLLSWGRWLPTPTTSHTLCLGSLPTLSEETGHWAQREVAGPFPRVPGWAARTRVSVLATALSGPAWPGSFPLPSKASLSWAQTAGGGGGAVPRGQQAGGVRGGQGAPSPHSPCLGGLRCLWRRRPGRKGGQRGFAGSSGQRGGKPSWKMWLRLSRLQRGRRARRMELCAHCPPPEPRKSGAPSCLLPPGAFQKLGLLRPEPGWVVGGPGPGDPGD